MSRLAARLRVLARDESGNTLAMIAAALIPLLAMTGAAVDMGRGYLAQNRLQSACDAGVLAARKRLGTGVAVNGEIPADVSQVAERFFNLNFGEGSYGTRDRTFDLTLEADYSLSGKATVVVPTTVMDLFGFDQLDLVADCAAQASIGNTDVMMVLDVTGSMNETNPGDSSPKIDELKLTVKDFYNQLSAATPPQARLRLGFVPYSTNVNAGSLLEDDWVAKQWTYQSRKMVGSGKGVGSVSYWAVGNPISGTLTNTIQSTYTISGGSCSAAPAGSLTSTYTINGTTTEPYAGPPVGTLIRTNYRYKYNGNQYVVEQSGTTCTVRKLTYSNYIISYDWVTQPAITTGTNWKYEPISYDVSNWRTQTAGCMEEPDTYEIDDYGAIDFSRALDMDIDHVPTPGDSKTQWRPMYPELVYGRSLLWNGTGTFNPTPVTTTSEFVTPKLLGTAHCPTPARKLAEMSSSEVDAYLASLKVGGSTYHDIGMLWGGRLLSPKGLFATENQDVSPNLPTSRHMIFMTDGQTSALDLSYTAYGLEPLDRRRWAPGSSRTLTQTVEDRFSAACAEVKKRNITVWFIAYGTELNPLMTECAGPGHAFMAADADDLSLAFTRIANSIADLRVTK